MRAWLQTYFETLGDQSPTKEGTILMPITITVSSLHLEYKADMETRNFRPILSQSIMSRVLREHFGHVRFPKDTGLGLCDDCQNLKQDLLKTSLSDEKRTALKEQRLEHLKGDNTTRENKNKSLFLFLALLVKNKYFDTIEVNMLPVGHTHIDVDGIFGMLSNGPQDR